MGAGSISKICGGTGDCEADAEDVAGTGTMATTPAPGDEGADDNSSRLERWVIGASEETERRQRPRGPGPPRPGPRDGPRADCPLCVHREVPGRFLRSLITCIKSIFCFTIFAQKFKLLFHVNKTGFANV